MNASVVIPFVLLPDKDEELFFMTSACLISLMDLAQKQPEIILIDNGTKRWAMKHRVCGLVNFADIYLFNAQNLGYGPAINQGFKLARGEWLVACNNDIEFLDDWIENAIDNWGPRTGIISSHLIDHDPERKAGRQVAPWGYFFGALWMIHRDVLAHVGLLDEQFERGMYEDADYVLRIVRAGYEHVKAGWVKHVGNATWGKLPEQDRIYRENRARFEAKWPGITK